MIAPIRVHDVDLSFLANPTGFGEDELPVRRDVGRLVVENSQSTRTKPPASADGRSLMMLCSRDETSGTEKSGQL